jgi:hypothetical protein
VPVWLQYALSLDAGRQDPPPGGLNHSRPTAPTRSVSRAINSVATGQPDPFSTEAGQELGGWGSCRAPPHPDRPAWLGGR